MKLVRIQMENDTGRKWEETRDLALEIGASIWRIHPFKDSDVKALTHDETKMKIMEAKEATTAEIVYNIHYALQTAAMIDMCRISGRNFWIAVIASIVAIISVLINFFSMAALWINTLVE